MNENTAADRIEKAVSTHQTFLGRFRKQIGEDLDGWLKKSLRQIAASKDTTKRVVVIVAVIEVVSVVLEHLVRRLL